MRAVFQRDPAKPVIDVCSLTTDARSAVAEKRGVVNRLPLRNPRGRIKLLMSSHTQDTDPDHGKRVEDANR